MRWIEVACRGTAARCSELKAAKAGAFGGEGGALAMPPGVRRGVGYAAADDADGDLDGRKADAPPRGADGVVVYVAEDVDGAVDAEDGEDGATWCCECLCQSCSV